MGGGGNSSKVLSIMVRCKNGENVIERLWLQNLENIKHSNKNGL